ncbi:MAG: hypothetical protein AABX38_01680 [Candidatus Micrarchaeota archaeon]
MVNLMVEVTNPELNATEDLITAWTLCNAHLVKRAKDEAELFSWQNSCKSCQKEKKKIRDRSLKLWGKLVRAYDSPKRKKHKK